MWLVSAGLYCSHLPTDPTKLGHLSGANRSSLREGEQVSRRWITSSRKSAPTHGWEWRSGMARSYNHESQDESESWSIHRRSGVCFNSTRSPRGRRSDALVRCSAVPTQWMYPSESVWHWVGMGFIQRSDMDIAYLPLNKELQDERLSNV